MTTKPLDPGDRARPGHRTMSAVGLAVAALLVLVGWASLRSLGPLAVALGAWFLAGALPEARERRAVRGLLVLLGTIWILHAARWVVYPLLAGMLAALLLAPVVDWLEAKRVRRPLAAILTLLPIGLLVALVLALLVPAVIRQGQLLVQQLPDAAAYLVEHGRPVLRMLGQDTAPPSGLPATPADTLAAVLPGATGPAVPPAPGSVWLQQVVAHAETFLKAAIGGLSGVGKGLGVVAQYVGLAFLTPVVAFHLLVDRDRLRATALRWLPPRWHDHALRVVGDIGSSLQVYLRGQFLVAALEAVLFSIAFAIAGIPQPVALGVLAGLFSLVPVLGFWLTILLVILNAVTGPTPLASLLKSGIGIVIINAFESQVLVPRVQGSGLGLHPLAVLLGVLMFGTVFGFVGVLLAVPAMGVIRAALPRLEEAWARSEACRGGADDQIDSAGREG